VALLICALVGTMAPACSSRKPVAAPVPVAAPPSPREVEALIERGCFRCLEQAFSLAEQRGLKPLAFEAAALLALRSNELGMPVGPWIDKARVLAADDPAWTQYLEMVAAVPPDPMSGRREDLLVVTRARNQARALLPDWYSRLANGALSVSFRRYLELALTCDFERSFAREDTRLNDIASSLPDVPLLKYRLGICRADYESQLPAARADVPELVDADLALGRYALTDPKAPDPDKALRLFQSAAAAFPASTSIPMQIGNLYQSWEAWPEALAAYDTALALVPAHPDAQLGRVISLSQLGRHEDAIAAATLLIDGARWHLGQAFYWRAWNHFNLEDNSSARADADRTRTLMVNPAVFVLSGLIEWRFRRLEPAEKEFQEALTMDFGQCEAAFYLGGVRSERAKFPEAIAGLTQALQCYDLSKAVRRRAIDALIAGSGTPEAKAREVARHERAIAAVEKRQAEARSVIERIRKVQGTK
jgi:tetratricopeptide (TPR) repeat protein